MKIIEHKITTSGPDNHQMVIVDWFNRKWKILVNDNTVKKITTAHLWDNGQWRSFAGYDLQETVVFNALKENKIVKLKYKVQ